MALFHGPVRVPDEAGNGKAKVTVSFAAWKVREARSSTREVWVGERPAAETKAEEKKER
jgi:hypothetical protein